MTPDPEDTARLHESPLRLLRRALGDRKDRHAKARRLFESLRHYGDERHVGPRMRQLQASGYIDEIPTRLQRIVGAIDMLRFFIVPCAADYYQSRGINFYFHTLLRFLDDPASVTDPTGFNSTRDTIIGHVLQVVHANPDYDLQLLASFPDGLQAMEDQIVQILAGTHPRTASIMATVEDAGYHARLLEHVRAFRTRPARAPALLRDNVAQNPRFRALEQTFGELPNAMRYFSKLPRSVPGALRHLVRVRAFPGSPD